jgi:hypothetical protein
MSEPSAGRSRVRGWWRRIATSALIALEALSDLWGRVDVMQNPTARIVEVVETAEY